MSVRTSGDIERLRKSLDPRLISNGREQDKILRAKRRAMKLGRDAYSTPGERAKASKWNEAVRVMSEKEFRRRVKRTLYERSAKKKGGKMGQAMQKQAAKSEFVELKQSQTILFPGAKPEHKERSKTSRQRKMSRRRIQISSTEDESENASEGEEDKQSEADDAAARKTKKPVDDDHIYANAAQPK